MSTVKKNQFKTQTSIRRQAKLGACLAALLTVVSMQSGFSSSGKNMLNQFMWDFETERSDRIPRGWSQQSWGDGTTAWSVKETASGKVLAQLASQNPNRHYNMAVYDSLSAKNVSLTVRLRAITGKHDQGGGFVWRYLDEQNHYIVRANPLEGNVVLYKMEKGVRTNLPLVGAGSSYGLKVSPLGKSWHTLKLQALEDEFTVYLDGLELFRIRDTTFQEPGRVGLWTKSDAVTWFDDFFVQLD